MDLVQFFKNIYYSAEDKWYDALDFLDQKQIPVYRIIDPVDRVVPSFLLFILTLIFVLILIAYLLQFYSPTEFTFTTMDSISKQTLSGVEIYGVIDQEKFSEVTLASGEAKVIIQGKARNLFEKIGSLFFGEEDEFIAVISAEKSGYNKIENEEKDLSSKEATINLTALNSNDTNGVFASSTVVELVDNDTGLRIVDQTAAAYIKYNCSNKGISQKTSFDGYDGVIDGAFKLVEPACGFAVKEAYSPGYETLSGVNVNLVSTQNLHTIRLTKLVAPVKGFAKIYVTEKNSSPSKPLANIQINFLDLMGNTVDGGLTDYSGVLQKEITAGTYVLTATSLDGNYYSIDFDANQLIVITVGNLSEKALQMQKMDPTLARFLRIKVVDYNGRTPLKDVKVFTQKLVITSDGNRAAQGTIGSCSNSCKTDSNGIIIVSGLSVQNEQRVVVSLSKDNYLMKIFEPALYKTGSIEFETVEMKKADYTEEGNAGKGLVVVKAKRDSRPLLATTYMYYDSLELNISNISLVQAGIITSPSTGEALFNGLEGTDKRVYHASANYEGILGSSAVKSVDVNQLVTFDINIDTEVSFLEVNLISYNGMPIVDKNSARVIITSPNTLPETLSLTPSSTFKSRLHDRQSTYSLSIDLNGYAPIANNPVTLSQVGSNLVTKMMYTTDVSCESGICISCDTGLDTCVICDASLGSCISCNTITGICVDSNEGLLSSGGILAVFHGLYETLNAESPGLFLDLNNTLPTSKNGYYTKVSYVLAKNLIDGNVLGALRVNDKMTFDNISYISNNYLNKSAIYSCLPQEKRPYNDDNYYIQPVACETTVGSLGKQVSAKWDKNVSAGVYTVTSRAVFAQTAKDGDKVDFNYSAKKTDFNLIGENLNRTTYEIGAPMCTFGQANPNCSGLFFYSELNNNSIGSERFSYNSSLKRFSSAATYELNKDLKNILKIKLFNNYSNKIDLNVKVYSYNDTMNSFNFVPSGFLHFNSITGVQEKTIGSNISVESLDKSVLMDVNVFTDTEKISSYIVVVAQLKTGEKYSLFINTVSPGRKLFLLNSPFLSGVPDQVFDAEVLSYSNKSPVDVESVEWRTLKDCDDTNVIATGTAENIVENYFSMQIPGVYAYNKDCLKIIVKPKLPLYDNFSATYRAGTGGITDPLLSCVTPSLVESTINSQAYLQWGQNTTLVIRNNCADSVDLKIETRLVLDGNCTHLEPEGRCEVKVNAINKEYLSTVMHSDILGVFPIYVKAKLSSSLKKFSLIKTLKVHVANSTECFSISKDTFDLVDEPNNTSFILTDDCQYTEIGDYFIPKAQLDLSGINLGESKPTYGNIKINYQVLVVGGAYTLKEEIIKRIGVRLDFSSLASSTTHERMILSDSNFVKYTNFHFDIPSVINASSEDIMFKWIDNNEDSADGIYYHGAKIDGNYIITYMDGTKKSFAPTVNFDLVPQVHCVGVDGECLMGPDVGVGFEDGGDTNMVYGLVENKFTRGKVKSVDFNIIGNPNPNYLQIQTKFLVDYNEISYVAVKTGGTDSNTLLTGSFFISPVEGAVFLVRNYANPIIDSSVSQKVNFCKKFLTNTGWFDGDKVYWTNKYFLNKEMAKSYCQNTDNSFFTSVPSLVSSVSQISDTIIGNLNSNVSSFNWLNESIGQGFWTDNCTDQNCEVLLKKTTGFVSGSSVNSVVDTFSALCVQDAPNEFSIDALSCNNLGVIYDSASGTCIDSNPILFDSFQNGEFVTMDNPRVEVKVISAETDGAALDGSAIGIWMEGGILKATFLGKDYNEYNDKTIEMNIINGGASGDRYGLLRIVDYVNKGKLKIVETD